LTPVRFLRSAQADIRAEKSFYRKISPELAIRFQTAVQAAVQGIAFQPLAMQIVDFDIRRWPVDHGFPHGILYRVEERQILILAVFHPKQDPELWKARAQT
jgi:plasmid stabilization system protein ParE